ncbi:MAG TPA: mechanosensitive ion channel domain-containing protein [bacterium]|nr:mechanosensitive ion channel domain-containing protein [bacterium]
MSGGDVLQQIARDVGDPRAWAAVVEHTVAILIIAVAAWSAIAAVSPAIRRAGRRPGRPVTFAPLAESAVRYTIGFAALILMLQVVNVNLTAILASAGVVSLALGFGAQYVIRDVLAGLFLISEGVVQIGDVVRLDADTGTVERITLRMIQIRKFNGELLTVPNGAVTRIGNLSRGLGRAIVTVTLPYRADVGRALEILAAAGREWAAAHPDDARGAPSVDGAVEFKDAGVAVQLSILVPAGRQWGAESAMRRRVLELLAEQGIKIDTRVSVTI